MRGSLVGFFVVLALVVGASNSAAAETVVANSSTSVHLKPGERSKVVIKVKSGQKMTVVRREGRWLKVRVRGRTGFIPRTKVSGGDRDGDEEEVARQTRRRPYVDGRSTDRGWGGEPPEDRRGVDAVENIDTGDPEASREVEREPERSKPAPRPVARSEAKPPRRPVVARDDDRDSVDDDDDVPERPRKPERARVQIAQEVRLRAKPAAKSKSVARVDAGSFYLLEERGGWARVESEDGERGWVSSKLILGERQQGLGRRLISLGAQVGFASVVQGTRTAGGAKGLPDNYNLSTSGVNVNVDGLVAYPVKDRIYVGGELLYVGTKALPGIVFMGKTTGISLHNVDVRGLAGYDLRTGLGMVVWGRLGYHYDMFSVADVSDLTKNTAKLPSESLSGVTAGLSLALANVTDKIGVTVGVDALLFSSREQTKNLEDGASPSTSGLWATVSGVYHLASRTTIDLGYRLTYLDNSFGTPQANSMRGHTGASVTRVDVFHGLSIGMSQSF